MSSTIESRTAMSPTPPATPRLRLQPDRPTYTLLDGGWWPRSADPAAELPGLRGRPAARPYTASSLSRPSRHAPACRRPETPMTSLVGTSRHAGGRPGAGPPAARSIVRPDGALDVAAAPALRERLISLLHSGTRLLVLDLSRVSSCDSAGLAVLVGAQRRARVLGIVMRLAAPSVPVAKLLRLTGLDRSITITSRATLIP